MRFPIFLILARGAGTGARRRRRRGWVVSGWVHWCDGLEDAVAAGAGEEVFDNVRGGATVHVRGDAFVAEDVSTLRLIVSINVKLIGGKERERDSHQSCEHSAAHPHKCYKQPS
jgi:hypothetical protein